MLFRLSWRYLTRHKIWVVMAVLLQAVSSTMNLILPTMNAKIIDQGVSQGNISYVVHTGAIMLGLTVIQIVCTGACTYLSARLAMGLGRWLRKSVFQQVQTFANEDLSQFGAGSLVTRCTNDVTQIQTVVLMIFTMVIITPIMGIGSLALALSLDVPLSSILFVSVPLVLALLWLILRQIRPLFDENQNRLDQINLNLREQLTGVRVIRAFNRQTQQAKRFDQTNTQLYQVCVKITFLFAFLFPTSQLIIGLSSAAAIWFGAFRIQAGGLELGGLTAYLTYLMHILFSIMVASFIFMMLPRATVSAQRINQVLTHQPLIQNPTHPQTPPAPGATWRLSGVDKRYADAQSPALSQINLVLKPGEITGVIGSTGSGKSTLVNLFPRLLDPSSGTLELIGTDPARPAERLVVDARRLSLKALRQRIALVPQRAYLFAGTIAENIIGVATPSAACPPPDPKHSKTPTPPDSQTPRLDTDPQLDLVHQALRITQAEEFVLAKAGGLSARVEAGGQNFSGGQRQRLTIARAIYRVLSEQADLLIFDDAFSALDLATEAALRKDLLPHLQKVSCLVVSQRVSTIECYPHILVLDRGKIAGYGTHQELLATCPVYQQIVTSQRKAQA